MQSGGDKKKIFLRRATCRYVFYFSVTARIKKLHTHVAATVQYNWGVIQCMQSVEHCIHLPSRNLLLAHFGNSAAL